MTRRVVLTGATGFVGRQAIVPLRARGFEVHALGRRPTAAPGVVDHLLDLLSEDPAPLLRAIRPTHLLHLAWDVTPGRFWTATENLDWVSASLRLYRAFLAAGGDRVAVAGTCAEYDWTGPLLDEATTPLRPATLYGVAKHALHQLLAASGANLAWGRVFFLYGPHEAPSRLVPSVIAPLLRGEPALVGDGMAERDLMHVADVARALVALLDSSHVGAANVATGACLPLRTVVQGIADQLGRKDLVRFGARLSPPGEPARLAASTDVITGLGFRSKFTVDTGISDTIGWWKRRMNCGERHDVQSLIGCHHDLR